MKRRDFLKIASGAAGGAATVGAANAAGSEGTPLLRQEGNNTTSSPGNNTTAGGNQSGNQTGNQTGNATGNQTGGGGGLPGQGTTETVELVDYAFNPGTDQPLQILPGTQVEFVWQTGGHNILVDSQPSGSSWSGHEAIEDAGFSTSHTFETLGGYHIICEPHQDLGMVGDIEVVEQLQSEGGGGQEEIDPEEMGVPFQPHFVGIATVVMMLVSLVFTFFSLKYGESRNTSSPNRR